MPSEPLWLTPDDLEAINRREVEETGETHFTRDRGLLESAAAKPINRWLYGDTNVVRLAVALLHGIAQNHCFEQGNKRTAATAALLFLDFNGYEWVAEDDEDLGHWIVALIEGRIGEDELADLMSDHLQPIKPT
ncbi:MAG: type II toxin-antitoxin system death-on-curing family toxin [Alphaproteobacteria bacterium]